MIFSLSWPTFGAAKSDLKISPSTLIGHRKVFMSNPSKLLILCVMSKILKPSCFNILSQSKTSEHQISAGSRIFKISCVDCDVPDSFSLSSAYPNPFNGSISFDYYVPSKESIEFTIYDLTGKEIINKLILPGSEGNHRISWDGRKSDGSSVSSGMYFYSFKSNNIINKGKVTYLK